MVTSLRVTPNSTSGASVAVWDYFLGAPYNKRNREQRIRVSTYQKSCIVKYTVSEVEIILCSLFPFIVRSFLQYFKYWYFMELHTNINENASNLKIFNEIYEFPRREWKIAWNSFEFCKPHLCAIFWMNWHGRINSARLETIFAMLAIYRHNCVIETIFALAFATL